MECLTMKHKNFWNSSLSHFFWKLLEFSFRQGFRVLTFIFQIQVLTCFVDLRFKDGVFEEELLEFMNRSCDIQKNNTALEILSQIPLFQILLPYYIPLQKKQQRQFDGQNFNVKFQMKTKIKVRILFFNLEQMMYYLNIQKEKSRMGDSESKQQLSAQQQEVNIPTDPLIKRLRSTFRLKISEKEQNKTHSFIHSSFSQQIIKRSAEKVNPNFSPFCYINSPDPKQPFVITCALISPIMVLAPSRHICNETGYILLKFMAIQGVLNNKKISVKVKKTMLLKDNTLVLMILQKPLWQLGWCGLSYLEESEQINNLPFHIIKNQLVKDEKHSSFYQKLLNILCTDEGGYMGKSARSDYGLLFEIIERKPYIKGLMIQTLCFFFDLSFIENLQKLVQNYLQPQLQREFLKEIDLEQMEIQTSW